MNKLILNAIITGIVMLVTELILTWREIYLDAPYWILMFFLTWIILNQTDTYNDLQELKGGIKNGK